MTPKGKSFKLPVQKLSLKSILANAAAYSKNKNAKEKGKKQIYLPTALVLQFEIDLNAIARNNYYLIGYLRFGRGKNATYGSKITIPKVKEKETKLELPGDKLAFGNIVISYKKLLKIASAKGDYIFTPKLYPNPHAAYDINGLDGNPSPPAGSDI